jgi:plasmid stability protein
VKTTLDLPDELVREMKLRAVMQGRTLRDLAADFIRQGLGLAAPRSPQAPPGDSRVQLNPAGLPVIRCSADAPAPGLTVDDLLALEQQSQSREDMQRAGLPL